MKSPKRARKLPQRKLPLKRTDPNLVKPPEINGKHHCLPETRFYGLTTPVTSGFASLSELLKFKDPKKEEEEVLFLRRSL